ncbi:ankyrin repeat-containing domain protein, partial [Lentinula raphanica]
FRYIECQLQSIRKCASPRMVEKALSQLPMDLKETYTRTLQECKTSRRSKDIHYLLMWLLYSLEPLHISQVATVLSIDMKSLIIDFDAGIAGNLNKFIDETLVTVNTDNILQITHGSVKEFLLESHNNIQVREIFNFNAQLSHNVIAHMCLVYILSQDKYSNIGPYIHFTGGKNMIKFDQYAVQYWAEHSHYNENQPISYGDDVTKLIATFLQKDSKNFISWQTKFYNSSIKMPIRGTIFTDCTPLHIVAFFGLTSILSNNSRSSVILSDIDILSKTIGTATQVAAAQGYKEIVAILLKHNADVNIQGGYHGTALQAAATGGHTEIVKLLLNHDADVNIQGGHYGTALQAAAFWGYKVIVELLLEHDLDINTQGGFYGTALQAAAFEGHKDIIKLLLENGADVNIQGGYCGAPLQAAALCGYKDIVDLLLKHNANVNALGGKYGTALQAAVVSNHKNIIEILLKSHANVNAQGGLYGTALQAAAFWGYEEIIQLLLKYGSNTNVQAGKYGNALQAAAVEGHKDIVELLLKSGADIDAQGGPYKTALQAAILKDHKDIIDLLLESGADIDSWN